MIQMYSGYCLFNWDTFPHLISESFILFKFLRIIKKNIETRFGLLKLDFSLLNCKKKKRFRIILKIIYLKKKIWMIFLETDFIRWIY